MAARNMDQPADLEQHYLTRLLDLTAQAGTLLSCNPDPNVTLTLNRTPNHNPLPNPDPDPNLNPYCYPYQP